MVGNSLKTCRYVRLECDSALPIGREQGESLANRLLLKKLADVPTGVEFRRLRTKGWCIRTIRQVANDVPVAAIGNTFEKAAQRLLRIIEFAKTNQYDLSKYRGKN